MTPSGTPTPGWQPHPDDNWYWHWHDGTHLTDTWKVTPPDLLALTPTIPAVITAILTIKATVIFLLTVTLYTPVQPVLLEAGTALALTVATTALITAIWYAATLWVRRAPTP